METNEIIIVENNKLVIAKKFLTQMKKDYEASLRLKKNSDLLKELGKDLMEKYGINEVDNNVLKMEMKSGHKRKVVDADKLKLEGIYEDYVKEIDVKPSVSISYKW